MTIVMTAMGLGQQRLRDNDNVKHVEISRIIII